VYRFVCVIGQVYAGKNSLATAGGATFKILAKLPSKSWTVNPKLCQGRWLSQHFTHLPKELVFVRVIGLELIAIISPPILYGLICLPLSNALLAQYPNEVNSLGGTHSTPLVVAIELIQLITLIVCGAALQGIAGHLPRFKLLLLGITVEMLVIAIWVEAQYWNAMPIWHHFVFFALVILGLAIGSALADRWRAVRT
jgi:hypothetical protein